MKVASLRTMGSLSAVGMTLADSHGGYMDLSCTTVRKHLLPIFLTWEDPENNMRTAVPRDA